MKKIVIFGATGNTGQCSLDYAVQKGLKVKVFVRNASSVPEKFKGKIEISVGNVTNSEQVSKAIEGTDGVVVVLGTRNDLQPTTVLSQGIKNIIDGMKKHNVQLISVCLSAFLFYDPEKVPTIFKDLTEDHRRMYNLIKESGLKWISVFPPHIAEERHSNVTVKYDESPGRTISKYYLAEFLVDCLDNPEHYQRVCGITSV
ncbi:flavin reductase (NADPH) [Leptopilina boulardi]|uniref:flavin reductase (NADPH) n=1 Tax=Leptopilina boulardi TaxID=63433 RepID=UPI0021F6809D|nr:flavin reductase (NADPH) [Leptopilina boulardi]